VAGALQDWRGEDMNVSLIFDILFAFFFVAAAVLLTAIFISALRGRPKDDSPHNEEKS
jgi:hypothetical protein